MMKEAKRMVDEKKITDTKTILKNAFSLAQENTLGSCTVVLFTLTQDVLDTTSIGDSGFRIIRDGKIIYRSIAQQHEPNKPYQLGENCVSLIESSNPAIVFLKNLFGRN